ncbi:MAG: hypothetical protein LBM09_01655, partial [Candidatus Nomurabacteria bacterium]|nr:hypothetical protein [Candidatus Nomurabacteria bacterium]
MGIITKIATKNARSWLKNHWQYIIIFVAAIICTWAYLRPIGETIISVDAKFHIHRYFSFEVGLFNGGLNSFAESGIGSEPTIFYGPFQAAIVTVLHFLLSDMALAINIFIFLAVFFAGVLMYKFIKKY